MEIGEPMLTEPITVREATAEDIPFLRAMIWEAILASPAVLIQHSLETMQQLEDHYWGEWTKRPDVAFVAIDATGRKLGAIIVKPDDTDQSISGWRIAIGVEADARSHGVGQRLLKRAIAFARSKSAAYVNLYVDPSNTPAIALYRRTGFVETGKHDHLLEMRIIIN